MGFFDRQRRELERRGIDAGRLPPGQYVTDRFPVLHAGGVPHYRDLTSWDLRVFGLVGEERRLSYQELTALASLEVTVDIHCVTKWSKFDTRWRGVPLDAVLDAAGGTAPGATHLLCHSELGFTTNVPLADALAPGRVALLAYEYDGKPLEPEHGYPLRFFLPHLYFWKSAKWLRGLELMSSDRPGFWEQNGYHMHGDPFREQRFWGD